MTDYEVEYQNNEAACGEPFAEFVDFFAVYPTAGASVLDLGCGQGRDALMIAGLGHTVHGVDLSPTGIAQMMAHARDRGLAVTGEVGDLREFKTQQKYDVVVLDRVLHMLTDQKEKERLLATAAAATKLGGHLLLADIPANLPRIDRFFEKGGWENVLRKKGLRFMRKAA